MKYSINVSKNICRIAPMLFYDLFALNMNILRNEIFHLSVQEYCSIALMLSYVCPRSILLRSCTEVGPARSSVACRLTAGTAGEGIRLQQ